MDQMLYDRIDDEYQDYRESVLGLQNDQIFSRSYEIDMITSFYGIMKDCILHISEDVIEGLLESENILLELYEDWLKVDDGLYEELKNFVLEDVGTIANR